MELQKRRLALLPALLLGLMLAGCGTNDGLIPVSGTVTYDGKPIERGSISFMPVDGKGVTAGGQIIDGQYLARVSPGEMAVQIYGNETVEKPNPTAEEVERGLTTDKVQYIPTAYNRQSTLRVTITEATDSLDFDLEPIEGAAP